ncbi:MAG: aminotransferase class IV [Firmicutes bacterium]|nr:aminotransferase class IV [Bacillota bacterium]
MSDAVKDKYLYCGELRPVAEFDATYRTVSPSAYEVIRLMDGKPLFLEEHHARLVATLASIGQRPPLDLKQLRSDIERVAKANDVKNHNVKIVINEFGSAPEDAKTHIFLIATSYPTDEMYRDGVPTDLFNAVRGNPQAKIIDADLRARENEFIKENGLFEALLVNGKGEITEGSRSNLFFIKSGKDGPAEREIFTSPADGVLLGITRQRIFRICAAAGIKVTECPIAVNALSEYSAAFISGTSPKVLPISRIGKIGLDPDNPLLREIMKLYDREIENYNAQQNN